MGYAGVSPETTKSAIREGSGTGDGSTVTFAMGFSVSSAVAVLVFLNGVKQDTDAYSLSGSDCVFTAAPANTTNIDFIGIDNVGDYLEVADLGISTAKIATNAVTVDKINDFGVIQSKYVENGVGAADTTSTAISLSCIGALSSTGGTEILTNTFTALKATTRIKIDYSVCLGGDVAIQVTAALFRGSVAIGIVGAVLYDGNGFMSKSQTVSIATPDTSVHTYSVRVYRSSTSTTYHNKCDSGATTNFAGAMKSTMLITEYFE